jgi:pyruvate/2-oxoglutarate dehydrogenase complex dihydrolipoamide acyltransferase (E2) component
MDVALPKLADTLTEGTLARWLRQAGDPVRRGEALAELETDKISSELEAPMDGVLAEVLVAEGETVPVGTVVARIAAAGETLATAERSPLTAKLAQAGAGAGDVRATRLRDHLRASAARTPAGMCAREVPIAAALDRLPAVAEEAGRRRGGVPVATLPPSTSHIVMPALPDGVPALVQAGAPHDGHRLLTLCFDRRRLTEWRADELLREIAAGL